MTVTARDDAGNETVVTHTVTVVDETKPSSYDRLAGGRRGLRAAASRWPRTTRARTSRTAPGIESCVGDVADGADVDTSTLGEHTFTVQATDKAGNTDSKSVTYTVVDVTAPSIAVTTPTPARSSGRTERAAAYSCGDEAGGSGVATCTGTVAERRAVDTASVGEKTFKVRGDRQRRQHRVEDRHVHGGRHGAAVDRAGDARRRRGLLTG